MTVCQDLLHIVAMKLLHNLCWLLGTNTEWEALLFLPTWIMVIATSHGCKMHPKILWMSSCTRAPGYALGWNHAVNLGEGRCVGRKKWEQKGRTLQEPTAGWRNGDTQETYPYQKCNTEDCWHDTLDKKELQKILLAALELCMIRVARKKKHPESESLSVPETET